MVQRATSKSIQATRDFASAGNRIKTLNQKLRANISSNERQQIQAEIKQLQSFRQRIDTSGIQEETKEVQEPQPKQEVQKPLSTRDKTLNIIAERQEKGIDLTPAQSRLLQQEVKAGRIKATVTQSQTFKDSQRTELLGGGQLGQDRVLKPKMELVDLKKSESTGERAIFERQAEQELGMQLGKPQLFGAGSTVSQVGVFGQVVNNEARRSTEARAFVGEFVESRMQLSKEIKINDPFGKGFSEADVPKVEQRIEEAGARGRSEGILFGLKDRSERIKKKAEIADNLDDFRLELAKERILPGGEKPYPRDFFTVARGIAPTDEQIKRDVLKPKNLGVPTIVKGDVTVASLQAIGGIGVGARAISNVFKLGEQEIYKDGKTIKKDVTVLNTNTFGMAKQIANNIAVKLNIKGSKENKENKEKFFLGRGNSVVEMIRNKPLESAGITGAGVALGLVSAIPVVGVPLATTAGVILGGTFLFDLRRQTISAKKGYKAETFFRKVEESVPSLVLFGAGGAVGRGTVKTAKFLSRTETSLINPPKGATVRTYGIGRNTDVGLNLGSGKSAIRLTSPRATYTATRKGSFLRQDIVTESGQQFSVIDTKSNLGRPVRIRQTTTAQGDTTIKFFDPKAKVDAPKSLLGSKKTRTSQFETFEKPLGEIKGEVDIPEISPTSRNLKDITSFEKIEPFSGVKTEKRGTTFDVSQKGKGVEFKGTGSIGERTGIAVNIEPGQIRTFDITTMGLKPQSVNAIEPSIRFNSGKIKQLPKDLIERTSSTVTVTKQPRVEITQKTDIFFRAVGEIRADPSKQLLSLKGLGKRASTGVSESLSQVKETEFEFSPFKGGAEISRPFPKLFTEPIGSSKLSPRILGGLIPGSKPSTKITQSLQSKLNVPSIKINPTETNLIPKTIDINGIEINPDVGIKSNIRQIITPSSKITQSTRQFSQQDLIINPGFDSDFDFTPEDPIIEEPGKPGGFGGFIGFPGLPGRRGQVKKAGKSKFKRSRTPSLEAVLFNVRGKRGSKFLEESGLALRPIIK